MSHFDDAMVAPTSYWRDMIDETDEFGYISDCHEVSRAFSYLTPLVPQVKELYLDICFYKLCFYPPSSYDVRPSVRHG